MPSYKYTINEKYFNKEELKFKSTESYWSIQCNKNEIKKLQRAMALLVNDKESRKPEI